MKPGFDLKLQTAPRLIATPAMRQAMAILQMSGLELAQYVQQELTSNPFLEVDEVAVGDTPPPFEFNGEWWDYFHDASDLGYPPSPGPLPAAPPWPPENLSAKYPSLHEHLSLQLRLAGCDQLDQSIGQFLIWSLDDNGYLGLELAEVARALGQPPARVERVLRVIQGFDPPGVGARNLQECLLLQMESMGRQDPAARRIILEFLPYLAQGRYREIAREAGLTLEAVEAAATLIRSLDPKPGRRFPGPQGVSYVVPDAVVERVGKEYVVLVEESAYPRLTLSPYYRDLLARTGDAETRRFLENRLRSAWWLIRCIEQRRLTLFRVVEGIVEKQRGFLEKGVSALRPLTLREVAQRVGVHESTVSRAKANKYVQTPQGIYPLKFFFASGVRAPSGAPAAAPGIKKLLEEWIAGEDPASPLSDRELAARLKARGISISRRTVAKYRDEMGLPPSSQRRRWSQGGTGKERGSGYPGI